MGIELVDSALCSVSGRGILTLRIDYGVQRSWRLDNHKYKNKAEDNSRIQVWLCTPEHCTTVLTLLKLVCG